jgi:hypothetical protein
MVLGGQGLQGEACKPYEMPCTPAVLTGQGERRFHLLPVPRTKPSPGKMSARASSRSKNDFRDSFSNPLDKVTRSYVWPIHKKVAAHA